jgi:hypothetical protein
LKGIPHRQHLSVNLSFHRCPDIRLCQHHVIRRGLAGRYCPWRCTQDCEGYVAVATSTCGRRHQVACMAEV